MADIFKQFNGCLKKHEFDPNLGFNSFMFCRWLSGNPKTLMFSNIINYYYKYLDDKTQFDFIKNITNLKFIKYPSFKLNKPDISEIQSKYKINEEKALEYLEILDLNKI